MPAANPKEPTAADAAKLVHRVVPVLGDDGNPKLNPKTQQPATSTVDVAEHEVLSFRDYGTHVVVVTTDGQKLRGERK